MMEYIEKLNTKKEYTAPQMEVVSCDVQRFLCDSGDVCIDGSEGC